MDIDSLLTHIPPLISALIFGALELIVALSKPKNRLQRIFLVYLLAMFFWSISALMTLSSAVWVVQWFRLMTIAPIIMTVAFFYFVQTLFGLRNRWMPLIFIYALLFVPLSLFTPFLIETASLEGGKLTYEFGPLLFFVAIPGYALNFFSLAELTKGYTQTDDINQKNRFRYLIVGVSISILATLFNFTEWGKYPIDIAANTVTAVMIAYAILRHQLLDIRIFVRVGLLYSITTAILGFIYYLAISLVLQTVDIVSGGRILIFSIIVAGVTAIVIAPLRESAQTWVDKLFYREKYNAGLMLQRLSQATTSMLDLDMVTRTVLSDVVDTLHIVHAAIFVKDKSKDSYRLLAEQGLQIQTTPAFASDHPIVKWLIRHNQILLRKDLSVNPIFKSIWGNEVEYINEFQAELFVPISTKGDLVGFLVAGPKKSSLSYSHDDEIILSTLANQTAITIENARLYEDLENTFIETVVTLANAIDMRDSYTSSHSQRIAEWGAEVARTLGASPQETQAVYWGGLLHDVGKIGIPDSILKKPSRLDDDEWAMIRKHTILGAQLIAPIKKLAEVAPIIECSHERYNGSGYPHGLRGEDIPFGARIVGVVDSYSAMRDERSYKKPISHKEAMDEIKRNSGILYDPQVVNAFLSVVKDEEN